MAYVYPFKSASEGAKRIVWEKGQLIQDANRRWPPIWRSDICGKVMRFTDHGDTSSEYGWEIDHIRPVVLGGTDDIRNLQPLNWRTNRAKGDNYPWGVSDCP